MSKLRRGRVTGPLARYEAAFANALAVEGYAPGSIGNQQLRMAQLSRWLEAEGLDTGALSAEVVERFLASRRAAGCSYYVTLRGFSPLLDSLRGLGAAPSGPAPAVDTPLEILMQRYAAYLLRERGLRPESAVDYVRAAKAFLAYRSGEGEPDADGLSAGEVIGYVRCECAGDTVAHARRTTSRLRALLRFLFVDGVTGTPLADLVPSVANRRDDFVPTATSPGDVARLLSSCDRRTTVGRRDFAILTVLSRLGLRRRGGPTAAA